MKRRFFIAGGSRVEPSADELAASANWTSTNGRCIVLRSLGDPNYPVASVPFPARSLSVLRALSRSFQTRNGRSTM